jgi:hypothetical protein
MAEEVLLFVVWVSPFTHRIRLALKLKGVGYKYIEEDLGNKSPFRFSNTTHSREGSGARTQRKAYRGVPCYSRIHW